MKPSLNPQFVTYCIDTDCFGLKAGQKINVMRTDRAVKGDLVAIDENGEEYLARYIGPHVEMPDGTMAGWYHLIGVVV